MATGITIYGCEPDEADLFREMAPRCGVIPTFVEEPVSAENAALALGDRCISVGHKTRVTRSVLSALSRAGVRHVSTRSIGVDHIDVDFAASLGIEVGGIAYSPDSVADFTVMLVLVLLRDVRSVLRRADLHDYRLGARGRELRDLTVGVIGTGRIGVAVTDRLRGFGGCVVAHDSRPRNSADYLPLDELLRVSDVVTLHTPLNTGTHHLLDRHRIASMKPGAFVINTGRGPLIDTKALVEALESGHLGGAALDVLEGEEGIFYTDCRAREIDLETLVRLRGMPNVVITPHTAYYTDHALSDTVENTLVTCLDFGGTA
ncbi:NAD(P)-dependent oxidoreductase [Lentzea sp. NBRC 102530]|uniref:NAD(P)-dependent oxidoreductase n=1 Tax=Lentzea sp. NBRC 102530 TaxID=3032201 RepID=UPI0024A3F01E|nr:NAD(P)-dependent oxidoreductase [Lentzea sp. NBRC 102530]GLY50261.1 lactate dehydrogenase [Lentzea sp. NBRC 102530]